jgi:hypothetical protein
MLAPPLRPNTVLPGANAPTIYQDYNPKRKRTGLWSLVAANYSINCERET